MALVVLTAGLSYVIGTRSSGAPSADSADVGFLYDMTAHHEQAVQLSMLQLANGSDPTVQAFAREILLFQSYEIGQMRMRLLTWGFDPFEADRQPMAWMGMSMHGTDAMPGMASATEFQAFQTARGVDADALFLALMSDHHAGGVLMAEAAASNANDPWIVAFATRMERNQAIEINEMEMARQTSQLPANPNGFVPDFDDNADMNMGSDPSATHGESKAETVDHN